MQEASFPAWRQPWFRVAVLTCGAFALLAVLLAGLALGRWVLVEANRKDTPERFGALAEQVAAPVLLEGAGQEQPSLPELHHALNQAERALGPLADECDGLAPIAKEQLAIVRAQRLLLAHTPDDTAFWGGAALIALEYFVPGVGTLESGMSQVAVSLEAMEAFNREAEALHQRVLLNRLELSGHAERFSAPAASDVPLAAEFHETGFFSDTPDTFFLTNTSGHTLSNSLVRVRIRSDEGKTVAHVHFVKHWPAGAKAESRYSSGSAGYGRETVSSVAAITFQVLSPAFSTSPIELQRPLFGWPTAR